RDCDTRVYVRTWSAAGGAVDRRFLVDGLGLVPIAGDAELVASYDRDHREQRAFGFPAFGAATDVIERGIAFEAHRHGRGTALAAERTAREVRFAGLHAAVDGRMNRSCHDVSPGSRFRR